MQQPLPLFELSARVAVFEPVALLMLSSIKTYGIAIRFRMQSDV